MVVASLIFILALGTPGAQPAPVKPAAQADAVKIVEVQSDDDNDPSPPMPIVELNRFLPPLDLTEYSITRRPGSHRAVDFRAPVGTPIYATDDGEVAFAKQSGAYGLVVFVVHEGGYQTRYAHMKSIEVTLGQTVRQGDLLGYVGLTGRTTGPHLHFELLMGSDGDRSDAGLFNHYTRLNTQDILEALRLTNYEWSPS